MDELGLFTLALGLSKPWEVVDLKFSKEDGRLDLWIDFAKGAKFPCPSCPETKEGDVHDTLDRTWRHLNFFQYETYLHARVPRIQCGSCGVKQVEVPWARPGSGFTLLFELLVLSLSREMSVAAGRTRCPGQESTIPSSGLTVRRKSVRLSCHRCRPVRTQGR